MENKVPVAKNTIRMVSEVLVKFKVNLVIKTRIINYPRLNQITWHFMRTVEYKQLVSGRNILQSQLK